MNKAPKRILAIAAGVVLPVGGLAGTATASSASDSVKNTAYVSTAAPAGDNAITAAPPGCTATNVCFWNGTNYSDGPGRLSGSNSNWTAFSHSSCPTGTWNDCASSVYNNGTSCSANLWTTANYGGSRLTLGIGSGQTALSSTMNNAISSNNWSC